MRRIISWVLGFVAAIATLIVSRFPEGRLKTALGPFLTKQYMLFVLIGVSGVVMNLALTFLLTEFGGLYYLFSYVIATLITWTFMFVLHSRLTFRGHGSHERKAYARFIAMYVGLTLLNWFFVYVLTSIVGLYYLLSIVVVTAAISVISFLGNRFLVFNGENVTESHEIKKFYGTYADAIVKKRLESPYPLRRYAHRTGYETIARLIEPGQKVLDAGCGEGVLSWYLAERGAEVIAMDISQPNLENARAFLEKKGVIDRVTLVQGDAENIPFEDGSFDVVVSSHVLEHLPDFDKGARELHRVSRGKAIVALPTCLNLVAASQLGGADFWYLSKRAVIALPWGCLRILFNMFGEGVQEGYAGHGELPHIWRYPWVMRRRLKNADFRMKRFEAATLVLPYFDFWLPIVKKMDAHKHRPFLRNFGYGSIALLEKR